MPEPIYIVKRKRVDAARRNALGMTAFMSALIVFGFGVWAGLGIQGYEIPLVIISLAVTFLIFFDGVKKNAFAVFEDGLNPPSRPVSHAFMRKDYFVPYSAMIKVEMSESVAATGDPDAHPFHFEFHLRDGSKFWVNPIGGFGALYRYIKSEQEIVKVYRLLKVVMEEINKPENSWATEAPNHLVIPRAKFEVALRAPRKAAVLQ